MSRIGRTPEIAVTRVSVPWRTLRRLSLVWPVLREMRLTLVVYRTLAAFDCIPTDAAHYSRNSRTSCSRSLQRLSRLLSSPSVTLERELRVSIRRSRSRRSIRLGGWLVRRSRVAA